MAKSYSGLDKTEAFFAHYGRKGMKRGMNIFNPNYKPIGEKATEVLKEKGFESYQKRAQDEQWRKQTAEANAKTAATSVGKTAADRQREAMAKATSAGGNSIRRENLVKAGQSQYSFNNMKDANQKWSGGKTADEKQLEFRAEAQLSKQLKDNLENVESFLKQLDQFEKESDGSVSYDKARKAALDYKLAIENYQEKLKAYSEFEMLANADPSMISYHEANNKYYKETGTRPIQELGKASQGYRHAKSRYSEQQPLANKQNKEYAARKSNPSGEREAMNRASSAATKYGVKSAREKLLEAERKRQAAIDRR